ncbi:MAG: PQQ-like beta-propeller repeat protein, partial [Deltaproteobacteria bacterium]|nr:PQQ-like beta-propeller repeat protein [Deltaproteobacteria bacterium]
FPLHASPGVGHHAFNGPVSLLWEARYDGPASKTDQASALAFSPDGNTVFVTGRSPGAGTENDYATLAHDAATGTRLWEARYDGPASDEDCGLALAVGPDETAIFVTGRSAGVGTGADYATLAYDPATGGLLWEARYDGPASRYDTALAITISPDGATVFVTGCSSVAGTRGGYTTIAYDAATGKQLWVARPGGRAGEGGWARAITISPDGATVFVTGDSKGSGVGKDITTVAYDAATGKPHWEVRYDGPASESDWAAATTISPDGAMLFVTGYSEGTGTGKDYTTVAYDPATGEQIWAVRYDGPASEDDVTRGITISPDGTAVMVTGHSGDADPFYDYATLAYDTATGEPLWEARYNGPTGYDAASAVAASPYGSTVFVAGSSVGGGPEYDYATLAYDAATGEQLWEARYDGPALATDCSQAITISPDGCTVVVTGGSVGAGTGYDFGTVAYESEIRPRLLPPEDRTVECPAPVAGPVSEAAWLASAAATGGCGGAEVRWREVSRTPGCGLSYEAVFEFWAVDARGGESERVLRTYRVEDTTPPLFAVPDVFQFDLLLWPPNHAYAAYDTDSLVSAADTCGEVGLAASGCRSSQPEEVHAGRTSDGGGGDGRTFEDCVVSVEGGHFAIRSERLAACGPDVPRVYTLEFTATDECGNASTARGLVRVEHDRRTEQGEVPAEASDPVIRPPFPYLHPTLYGEGCGAPRR